MSSPGPSPADIQSHLYAAFLEGSTADVALRVSGSWSAIYRLHRVVLIQSGFFRSLFTSGWAESSPKRGVHRRTPDEIDILFDDANITRPAFEVCIARLYGGGPPLHISPAIIPTTTQPLTPSFPLPRQPLPVPSGHHPATPRFLLSLLATAVYLSIPYVASQALSAILSTIGPHSVILYHNFALGKPIGPPSPFSSELEAAVGLEHVAQPLDDDNFSIHSRPSSIQTTKNKGKERERNDPATPASLDLKTDSYALLSGDSSDEDELPSREMCYHYGAISDKIGEATSCWLARWAIDMLAYEEEKVLGRDISPLASGRRRAMTISTTPTPSMTSKEPVIPTIWARGGLSAKWVAAIASADTLFVRGERERYDFARSVVELRRRDGILQEEEREWTKLFNEGIYYSNMSPENIIIISQDVSPTTKRPFVPLSTLQAAQWNQSLLRHQIMFRPAIGSGFSLPTALPSSPTRDRELGLATPTMDLIARISALGEDEKIVEGAKQYYLVPSDSSLRIGDNGAATEGVPASMEQLFTNTHAPSSLPTNPKPGRSRPLTSEENFFGLFPTGSKASNRVSASSIMASDNKSASAYNQNTTWSPYPPYRFGVEFWDLDSLKEKNRLYSHTIWYAGSLYNIYVQIVRKKAQVQLGIYLHRQSNVDPIPPSSAPSVLALKGEKDRRREWEWERDKEEKETEKRERERGMSLSGTTSTSPTRNTHQRGPSLPIPLGGASPSSWPSSNPPPSPGSGIRLGRSQQSTSPTLSSSCFGGSLSSSPTSSVLRSGISISASSSGPSGTSSTGNSNSRSQTPVASSSSSGRSVRPSASSNTINTTTQSFYAHRGNTTPPNSISTTGTPGVAAPSSPTSPTISTGSTHLLQPHPAICIPIPTTNQVPATGAAIMPSQPYRDPRPAVKAYFTISCASATGASQTRFSSAPDLFAVSQSWGWKSSSLRTEEYVDVNNVNAAVNNLVTGSLGGDTASVSSSVAPMSPISPLGGLGDGSGVNGREVSLRATVVLGLV